MSKTILLAVDTTSHTVAAADLARDLAAGTGDKVVVMHVHEFAVGRFGKIQVDCGDGEGELGEPAGRAPDRHRREEEGGRDEATHPLSDAEAQPEPTFAEQVHGMPAEDASIWAQWQYLTEYPGVVRAEFL